MFHGLLLLIGGTLAAAAIVSVFWEWIIPDIFSGAVQQGLISTTLTFSQALKLGLIYNAILVIPQFIKGVVDEVKKPIPAELKPIKPPTRW